MNNNKQTTSTAIPVRYKGCMIYANFGKYVALHVSCETIEEAKKVIDDAFLIIKKSIK